MKKIQGRQMNPESLDDPKGCLQVASQGRKNLEGTLSKVDACAVYPTRATAIHVLRDFNYIVQSFNVNVHPSPIWRERLADSADTHGQVNTDSSSITLARNALTADNNGFNIAQYFQRDLQKISNKRGLTYTVP